MSAASLEHLESFYHGKRVLVTGDTGFKGAWLASWLLKMGAEVVGYALPATTPSLFEDAELRRSYLHVDGDVRDRDSFARFVVTAAPEIVFHLAAQAVVLESYRSPIDTIATNVLGTVNVLDAIRERGSSCALVVVTSDKCYAGAPPATGFREEDPLGGHDPYSASKAAAEIVTAGYRDSFFPCHKLADHGVALATARAGNVVGGGDWAAHRIVPDLVRALSAGQPVAVRHPDHVRPWQHVLEPLSGYLALARCLASGDAGERASYCEAWNFGPPAGGDRSVRQLVETLIEDWGKGKWTNAASPEAPAEANSLRLDSRKASVRFGWSTRWDFDRTCARTVEWYRANLGGARGTALQRICLAQIDEYCSRAE